MDDAGRDSRAGYRVLLKKRYPPGASAVPTLGISGCVLEGESGRGMGLFAESGPVSGGGTGGFVSFGEGFIS
jgi:hypothetical protein